MRTSPVIFVTYEKHSITIALGIELPSRARHLFFSNSPPDYDTQLDPQRLGSGARLIKILTLERCFTRRLWRYVLRVPVFLRFWFGMLSLFKVPTRKPLSLAWCWASNILAPYVVIKVGWLGFCMHTWVALFFFGLVRIGWVWCKG